ncbi:hypothetical protein ACFFU8_18315 [Chromobacterium piscinae]|uniref:hypothetical protein n=1 Tax=Chromobacterium piscinae TaxID=686831 RepID=UPI001E4E4442|nr:hypothetical protein [Chromobacterium piscinae]MCD5326729.1 hypothetical protein [Chromobacterium piscinae]
MFRKSLFSASLRHTSQEMINNLKSLEARRDDFELVEGLVADTRGAGLDAQAMFRPPATPYVSVRVHTGAEGVLQQVATARGLSLAENFPAGWLLVNPNKSTFAIEVVAAE